MVKIQARLQVTCMHMVLLTQRKSSVSKGCMLACRIRLEMEIEQTNKEQLEQRCYSERINQQTLFRWVTWVWGWCSIFPFNTY